MNNDKLEKRKTTLGSWFDLIGDELDEPYIKKLNEKLKTEYFKYKIHPNKSDIFRSFRECPLDKLKVVFIGEESYCNEHANGVAFSSNLGTPPTLSKIFDTMFYEIGISPYRESSLDYLLKQGVLLLDARLTVRNGKPKSHANIGWEIFMLRVIDEIFKMKNIPIVVLGVDAFRLIRQHKDAKLNKNYIVCEHPYYSAVSKKEWKSNDIFRRINKSLERREKEIIKW